MARIPGLASDSGPRAAIEHTLLVSALSTLLCLPLLHTVFWMGDEGEFLFAAQRMLHGKRLYADFFEFLPPGSFVLCVWWIRLVGGAFWSTRLLAILSVSAIAGFSYLACRRVPGAVWLSGAVTLGWLIMSQGAWTQVNHHWFTTGFSVVAAWASIRPSGGRRQWPFLAGLASGAAVITTPTCGALALLASAGVYACTPRRRFDLTLLTSGACIMPLVMLAYLIRHHAVHAAFDDVIWFTATRYTAIQPVPFGYFSWPQIAPLIYLFPLCLLLAVVAALRERGNFLHDPILLRSAAFAGAGFVGCFPRPDVLHIAFQAPLALPLLVHLLKRLAGWLPLFLRWAGGLAGGAILFHSAAAFLELARAAMAAPEIATARGHVVMPGQADMAKLIGRVEAAPAGDRFFFYPYMPLLPFLTERDQMAANDIFVPHYTSPAQYQGACATVMANADWVVIDRSWTDPLHWKMLFPAMRDAAPNEVQRFEQALDTGFQAVTRDGTLEMRHRSYGATPELCTQSASHHTR